MTQRDTGNKGKDADPARDDTPKENGVPGAFGNEDKRPVGQTGVSHTRSDHDEIEPSEDVDNA